MTKQIMMVALLVIYVLVQSLFIEPNSLDITRYQIESKELQGIRLAFLSDFHLKRTQYQRLDRIVKMTNLQNPDIVILGGDFAFDHNEKKSMNTEILAHKLSMLKAPTYAVLGDSDWSNNGEKITQSLKTSGIKVLENSSVRIILKRRYVDIIGLADIQTRTPKLFEAMKRTAPPRIVITHNPDIYFDIVDEVSLILAGHTHGGQFILPFSKPFFVSSKYGSEFAYGLVKKTINTMIISRGIGTVGIPMRLNCKPEIVIVDFVRAGLGSKRAKK